MVEDILCREIKVGNYVVYFNRIYKVVDVPLTATTEVAVAIKLVDSDKDVLFRKSKKMCLVDDKDVIYWKLKNGQRKTG